MPSSIAGETRYQSDGSIGEAVSDVRSDSPPPNGRWANGCEPGVGGRGAILICNHGGYGFDVYADGPDSFSDDLAGSFDERADWSPASAGQYEIGFSFPYAPRPGTLFQVRIKRNGHTQYKVFSGEGTFHTNVSRNKTTRIDTYVK